MLEAVLGPLSAERVLLFLPAREEGDEMDERPQSCHSGNRQRHLSAIGSGTGQCGACHIYLYRTI